MLVSQWNADIDGKGRNNSYHLDFFRIVKGEKVSPTTLNVHSSKVIQGPAKQKMYSRHTGTQAHSAEALGRVVIEDFNEQDGGGRIYIIGWPNLPLESDIPFQPVLPLPGIVILKRLFTYFSFHFY